MNIQQALKLIQSNTNKEIDETTLSLIGKMLSSVKIEHLEDVSTKILSQKWINYSSIKECIDNYKKDQLEMIEDSTNKYLNGLYKNLIGCFNAYENNKRDIKTVKLNGFKKTDGKLVFSIKDLQILKKSYTILSKNFDGRPFEMFYNIHNHFGNNILPNKLKEVIQSKIKEKHYQNLLPKKEDQKVLNLLQGDDINGHQRQNRVLQTSNGYRKLHDGRREKKSIK